MAGSPLEGVYQASSRIWWCEAVFEQLNPEALDAEMLQLSLAWMACHHSSPLAAADHSCNLCM